MTNINLLPLCLFFVLLLLTTTIVYSEMDLSSRIVYAINCGGEKHSGAHHIEYERDYLIDGLTSDYGRKFAFTNVAPRDAPLYQTERYGLDSFKYKLNLLEEGDFVLILKFSEVYFQKTEQKVFNVNLNNIPIINELDVIKETGSPGFAYDRPIKFSIKGSKLTVKGISTELKNGQLHIEFVKTEFDNPKVNAILILRGLNGLPPLPVQNARKDRQKQDVGTKRERIEDELIKTEDTKDHPEESISDYDSYEGVASGPRTSSPFDSQGDSSVFLIIISLLVFVIPVITILRKF